LLINHVLKFDSLVIIEPKGKFVTGKKVKVEETVYPNDSLLSKKAKKPPFKKIKLAVFELVNGDLIALGNESLDTVYTAGGMNLKLSSVFGLSPSSSHC